MIGQVLFPPSCLGCGDTEAGYICDACREQQLDFGVSSVGECTLWTLGSYEGLLKKCITSVKDLGQKAVAEELARLVADILEQKCPHVTDIGSVLAVPSSRQGQRFRGFSLPHKIEEVLRERFGFQELPQNLRLQYRSSQKTSRGSGREERLRKAIEKVSHTEESAAPDRGSLLLVDDVLTTGATMVRAIEQARGQGFSAITCLAVAEARA